MKHKMTNGQKLLIAILLITLIAATILGLYAWAKYVTSIPGETTAKVAKWHFDVKLKDGTENAEETVGPIDLSDTIDFEHVKSDRIAPGTNGKFEVVVNSKGTEVSYIYNLAFTVEKCPTNLIFYSKGAEIDKTVTTEKNGDKTATFTISKYVPKEKAIDGYFLETIYWDWPYETKDENGSSVAGDAQDKLDEGNNVSIKIVATGTEVLQAPSSDEIPEVEDTVELSQNGIVSFENDNNNLQWKVFYKDKKIGNTYLILNGYLPNELVPDSLTQGDKGLQRSSFSIYGVMVNSISDPNDKYASRKNLIAKLGDLGNPNDSNTKAWKQLLPEKLQSNKNIVVAGTPTLDLWVASWNAKHGATKRLYTRYQKDTGKTEGYLISDNSTVQNTDYSVSNLYELDTEKLYFPYSNTDPVQSCQGYWLASPSAFTTTGVMYVNFAGTVNSNADSFPFIGVRPVVRIPSDILVEQQVNINNATD